MADSNMQLNWTDEQWNKVRQVVYEEARKARVAGNFLPLYGPLEPDARYVSKATLYEPSSKVEGFTVTDTETLKLSTIQAKVYLRGAQVADPELTSALTAFRRAANVLARSEDEIIFKGQSDAEEDPVPGSKNQRSRATRNVQVLGGQVTQGLVKAAKTTVRIPKAKGLAPGQTKDLGQIGESLVAAVSEAIGKLEEGHHLGPFACVLGQEYFKAVQTPNDSLVLPQDRILPFLGGGTLLRSSVLDPEEGAVIALGGAPIDLVVATDITVKFLQVTVDPWFVFRVFEKIVLRINQPEAIAALRPAIAARNAAAEKKAAAEKAAAEKAAAEKAAADKKAAPEK